MHTIYRYFPVSDLALRNDFFKVYNLKEIDSPQLTISMYFFFSNSNITKTIFIY